MVHHDHRQFVAQFAIGSEVFAHQFAHGASNRRSFQVRIERAAAESGKMLAAAHHSVRRQAGEKFARIFHDSIAVAAAARVPITFAEAGSARSSTGASVVLKPKAFTARAISSPCSRESVPRSPSRPGRAAAPSFGICAKGWDPHRSHRLRGRHGRQRIAQPVHVPPSTSTQRSCAARTSAVASLSSARVCCGVRNIAPKENDARRTHQLEPCALQAGQLRACEAHHQQASRGVAQIRHHPSFRCAYP